MGVASEKTRTHPVPPPKKDPYICEKRKYKRDL